MTELFGRVRLIRQTPLQLMEALIAPRLPVSNGRAKKNQGPRPSNSLVSRELICDFNEVQAFLAENPINDVQILYMLSKIGSG
jgi:hypothetical protein